MSRSPAPLMLGVAACVGVIVASSPLSINATRERAASEALRRASHIPALYDPSSIAARAPELASAGAPVNALDAISANERGAIGAASRAALAYAPADAPAQTSPELIPASEPIILDVSGVREAIAAYRARDVAAGDVAAATTANPDARAAADWAAVRLAPRLDALATFIASHPDWPNLWARARVEQALYSDRAAPAFIQAWFAQSAPATPLGRLALARALIATGRNGAAALVRAVWREADLPGPIEAAVRRDFGAFLTRDDHKRRSDRLFYKESASLNAALAAGPDVAALDKARSSLSPKLIAALPPALKTDPTLLFARIQKLRRDGKITEAAQAVLAAPRDPDLLVNGDAWWAERRSIARKLLDAGDAPLAYKVAAEHSAASGEQRIEAEFQAGWIALRFLNDPGLAAKHFAALSAVAQTPMSRARADYWRGRAAEAMGEAGSRELYTAAAAHTTSYYGQLARARLGETALAIRKPTDIPTKDDRASIVRVIELLLAVDEKDLAAPLVAEAAKTLTDERQLAALAEVCERAREARLTLVVGKTASQRGFALDEAAFPTFGVPAYEALARSAGAPIVYAIARQESAFVARATSGAGAKGLMQMMPATARATAERAGVEFSEDRLISDPAFNAQLGAAHLGELIGEERGSLVLTFAAYNAGGRRVKEWIAAYGDPRNPATDPIDWVERIPFAETRNYVQRVSENLEVYRVRFNEGAKLGIEKTLRGVEARL